VLRVNANSLTRKATKAAKRDHRSDRRPPR
jgi:hypothetical protein